MSFKNDIYRNQSDIMSWLRSRGHRVVDDDPTRTRAQEARSRSCETKLRFEFEPPPTKSMAAYRCRFCNGWHRATAGT
jgi:hypothetical protein